MAVVGQLLVELSANVARLRTDMERAANVVESNSKRMAKAASVATGALGAIGAGLSVGVLTQSFMAAVDSMDALNDAADRTGASIGELSSLVNTLAPYGATLDQITEATGKLAQAMAGADDESKGAGAAFAALGVATRDATGNLRPTVDVLTDVSKAMAQYEDGTNKTVLVQAIFGRAGQALLPMLKDLANAQRVAGSVTAEQAEAAEKLNLELARIRQAVNFASVSIASRLIPDLAKLAEQFRVTSQAGGSFWESVRGALGPNKFVAELEADLRDLQQRRDRLSADTRPLMQRGKDEGLAALDKQIADVEARIARLRPAQRVSGALQDQMDGVTPSAAGLLGQAPSMGNATARAAVQRAAQQRATQTEAERLLATLNEQLLRTQDLTTEQQVLGRIGRGEIAGMNAALEQQILLVAARIDKAREQADEIRRATAAETADIEALNRLKDEAVRGTEREIEAIRNAIDPTRELYRQIERVQQLMANGLLPDDAGNARLMQLFSQVDGILQGLPSKAEEAASGMRDMLAPIESAFESAIMGGEKLSSVLSSLAQDFARMMLRQQITGPLAQILSGTFDASKSGNTIVGALFNALPKFADGGQMRAGYPALVGERGPEIVNPRHSGYVVPSGKSAGGGTIVQHFDMRNSALTRDVVEMAARRGAALGQAQARDARVRGLEFA